MVVELDSVATVYGADEWDGHEQVPCEINGSGIYIEASNNRNITIRVAGLQFYAQSMTINTKEKLTPIHGTSLARAYALLGGDIDGTGKFEILTMLTDGKQDKLRMALFDALHEGRAVYFSVYVDYNGDAATGGQGRHNLVTLRKCKANADSWSFSGDNKSSFDFDFIEDFWFGRKG
jgi:hypothetical protein